MKYRNHIYGISALWIVAFHIYHMIYAPLVSGISIVLQTGNMGVDVFLFLSAIGLSYSVEKNNLSTFYKKMWILLVERDISPATLRKDLNIATGTMTKMRKNEEVALSVLLRICEYLDCNIGDICDAVRVKQEGIDE